MVPAISRPRVDFPAPEGPIIPRISPGLTTNVSRRSAGVSAPGGKKVTCSMESCPLGRGSSMVFRGCGTAAMILLKAAVAQTNAAERLPCADGAFDRRKATAQQDGRREDRRRAHIVQDHQPGGACHDDYLSKKPDEARERLDCGAMSCGRKLIRLRIGLVVVQEASHSRQHPHGADRFDIAHEGLRSDAGSLPKRRSSGRMACASPFR